ncbi:MAG TPA: GNAT family N-acetyltransferase, partial [Acidobacteriota bacterium]|nr:GNAT family N-acetyltransferase [Acidobacteriota bacterium]
VVHLDGVVVARPLQGRGIGTALLDDFCARMANENASVVKTHFFLRQFCLPRGFQVDRRWGGLVRFLEAANEEKRN